MGRRYAGGGVTQGSRGWEPTEGFRVMIWRGQRLHEMWGGPGSYALMWGGCLAADQGIGSKGVDRSQTTEALDVDLMWT